ncbi:hypothetical protein AB9F42_34090, partial [Rhizobium leguminosarum]|uniref:hypothetical protein n=1 Tax=Rhizobium leguminosarum TaxID=384 RepID=UPI003F9C006D
DRAGVADDTFGERGTAGRPGGQRFLSHTVMFATLPGRNDPGSSLREMTFDSAKKVPSTTLMMNIIKHLGG